MLLLDLLPSGLQQANLFTPADQHPARSAALMGAIDRINQTFGRQTLRFGSEGLSHRWRMRARLKSPAYTTRWSDLPLVRTG